MDNYTPNPFIPNPFMTQPAHLPPLAVGGKPWKRTRGKWQKDRWTGDDEMWEGRK